MKINLSLSLAAMVVTGFILLSGADAAEQKWRERVSNDDEITSSYVEAEVAFGREVAARILGKYKAYDDLELVKYVNLVGLSLARNTSRPELEYHFTILDRGEINAYAAPGGYVFVTTGALGLMKDESELAGVLAHEISHITEMHVAKELKIKGADDSITSGMAQLVGGASESARVAFSQAVDKGVEMIFKDEYKREDEMQADKIAVMLCALSAYDASSFAKYLDRVRAVKGELSDNGQTHPSFASRIAQINDEIAKEGIAAIKTRANPKRFDAAMAALKRSAAINK